ncbi:MAG TPA: hypothetical protein VL652_31690 [Kutzneria sp.]|nr:hypothetical protein [Kutzneria sp.]
MADNDANLLSTHYFDSAAEAAEAVRAADLLGLGVALANRLVPDTDSDDGSFVEEWVVDVFASVPEAEADDSEAEVA